MEVVLVIAGLAIAAALARPASRRVLLPAEAEARAQAARGARALARADLDRVRALEARVRSAEADQVRAVLEGIISDTSASAPARGALMRIHLEARFEGTTEILGALLSEETTRQGTLHALYEVAADGDTSSSMLLLRLLEADDALARLCTPVIWALLVSGSWIVECRAIDILGRVGKKHDAEDLTEYFGRDPELAGRALSAARHIRERLGAHCLSLVDPEDGPDGRLSLSEAPPAS